MIEKYQFISTEQRLYSILMDACAKVCFVLLVLFFGLYVTGMTEPQVSIEKLGEYWKLPLDEYLEMSGQTTGWAWAKSLHYSDLMNILSLAILASITIFCYLRIIPVFIDKKDKWYILIAATQVIVFLIAAWGIII